MFIWPGDKCFEDCGDPNISSRMSSRSGSADGGEDGMSASIGEGDTDDEGFGYFLEEMALFAEFGIEGISEEEG